MDDGTGRNYDEAEPTNQRVAQNGPTTVRLFPQQQQQASSNRPVGRRTRTILVEVPMETDYVERNYSPTFVHSNFHGGTNAPQTTTTGTGIHSIQ